MRANLDQALVADLAHSIVRKMDEMSGSGASFDERKKIVCDVIMEVITSAPTDQELTTVKLQSIGGDLGINVSDSVEAKPVFG